jgi:hypothetical protein
MVSSQSYGSIIPSPKFTKSHVTDMVRAFLNAYTIRSKPFLPWNIEGRRRFISTTAYDQKVSPINNLELTPSWPCATFAFGSLRLSNDSSPFVGVLIKTQGQ